MLYPSTGHAHGGLNAGKISVQGRVTLCQRPRRAQAPRREVLLRWRSKAQLERKEHPVFAEPIGANLPSILRLAECYYDPHVKGRLMDFFLEAIKK